MLRTGSKDVFDLIQISMTCLPFLASGKQDLRPQEIFFLRGLTGKQCFESNVSLSLARPLNNVTSKV